MKILTNQQRQVVYRLESILDIALLPEHMMNNALESLPIMIHSTRAMLAAAQDDGQRKQIESALPSFVDLVDDQKVAASFGADGEIFASVGLKEPHA